MITCGTRCEPDASGPSDQSTAAAAAAAAPFALFSGDRRSLKKSVQSSDEMGMMIQLSIYCSYCRILRCVAFCCACERARQASIRRQWLCQFGVPNPVRAVAERIRTLDLLRLGFLHFVFWRVGWGGGLGQSFPLLKLYFGSSIFKIKIWIFLHTKSFRGLKFQSS